MKKILFVILLLAIALSGCVEERNLFISKDLNLSDSNSNLEDLNNVVGVPDANNVIKFVGGEWRPSIDAGGGGGGLPAGADTQVQYNDSGAFGADAGFTTDKAGSVTLTGTGQAEHLTSTDDITMSGYFLNTLASANSCGAYLDGYTNIFTGAEGSNYLLRARRRVGGAADNLVTMNSYGADVYLYNSFAATGEPEEEGFDATNCALKNRVYVTGAHSAYFMMGEFTEVNYGMLNEVERAGSLTVMSDAGDTCFTNVGQRNKVIERITNTGDGDFTIENYGGKFEVATSGGTAGVTRKSTALHCIVSGNPIGTSYGLLINAVQGAPGKKWGIYNEATNIKNFLGRDNIVSLFGTGKDANISFDGTDFVLGNSTGNMILSPDGNVNIYSDVDVKGVLSADDLIDRTPAWEGTEADALGQILRISKVSTGTSQEVDHDSLPDFTKRVIPIYGKRLTGREDCHEELDWRRCADWNGYVSEHEPDRDCPYIVEICTPEYETYITGHEEGRSVNATVTMLVEAVKELENLTRRQAAELEELNCTINPICNATRTIEGAISFLGLG